MKTINVNIDKLRKTLIENQEKHIKEYNESVEDYKAAVLFIAKKNLKIAKTGDMNEFSNLVPSRPNPPVSYEKEYERAIKQLEYSVDSIIELDEMTFNQLVLDEWSWKRDFVASASFYKSFNGV